jgi:DnaK suppressor protein
MAKERMLTDKQIKKLEKRLLDELDGLIFRQKVVSDEFNLDEEDRSDEVDLANADTTSHERLRFRNREVLYEKKIRLSLEKIKNGTYGVCDDCECQIGFKRLEARPTAELCIMCKEESERDENSSFLGRQSKSLGKKINLVAQV